MINKLETRRLNEVYEVFIVGNRPNNPNRNDKIRLPVLLPCNCTQLLIDQSHRLDLIGRIYKHEEISVVWNHPKVQEQIRINGIAGMSDSDILIPRVALVQDGRVFVSRKILGEVAPIAQMYQSKFSEVDLGINYWGRIKFIKKLASLIKTTTTVPAAQSRLR